MSLEALVHRHLPPWAREGPCHVSERVCVTQHDGWHSSSFPGLLRAFDEPTRGTHTTQHFPNSRPGTLPTRNPCRD